MAVTITLKNVKVGARNFSGKVDPENNPQGKRYFIVFIPEEDVEELRNLGLNVKRSKNDSPEGDPRYYLKIRLSFKENEDGSWYPKILAIPENRSYKNIITGIMATQFDQENIVEAETLVLRLLPWTHSTGGSGVNPWLSHGAFIIKENAFDLKYDDIPSYSDFKAAGTAFVNEMYDALHDPDCK